MIVYIPYYCDTYGTPPGQLFEGCGNVVSFHLWIFAFGALPVVVLIMIASIVAIFRHHRKRRVQAASTP